MAFPSTWSIRSAQGDFARSLQRFHSPVISTRSPMKALSITAAMAALVITAGCGGDAEQDAGASVETGTSGTVESTSGGTPQPGTGAPSATVETSTNAPPAMTSPATEGDTTVRTEPRP
jgi:hypothetical protein